MKVAISSLALTQALALLSATATVVTAAPSGQAGDHSLVARGCTSSTQCASTKYCDNGTCRTKVDLNATCRKDQQCKSGLCFSQKCTSSTARPNGAPCTASTSCTSGNCQNSVCAAKKSTGGACYKDVNCSSGHCDTKKGTCAASNLLANGKACTTSASCSSGNCQNSKCAAKKSTGGACYKDVNCVSNSCDTKKGTCAAASSGTTSPTPTSTSPAAGNTGGGSVYVPTPASRSASPTARPATPSADGETTDIDFSTANAPEGQNVHIQRTNGITYLQATVPDGGQAVFTVPVITQAAAGDAPAGRKRQEDGNTDPQGNPLPDGMIVNYQYQLASMTVADPNRQSHCYITTSFSSPVRDADDFARPFGVELVDSAWKTSQAYGEYYNGDELWTSISVKASCDPGVTAVFNTATISHLDGPQPTVEDWFLTPTTTPTADVEEFTNGGFETGDLTGWSGLSNAAVITGTAPNDVYSGTKAVHLTVGGAAGQTATLSQILSPHGAAQQRRQVGTALPPAPIDALRYNYFWRMKIVAHDASGAASNSTADSACFYSYQFNGQPNGVQGISLDVPAPGWFGEGIDGYPIYYITNDVAKAFDFTLTCPTGVSMTMALDDFTLTATYDG